MADQKQRVQKLLSEAGFCSRRNAEKYIREGKLKINHKVATLGDKADWNDEIICDGVIIPLKKPESIMIAWNKPPGVEITFEKAQSDKYKTLQDFDFGPERVFPIGHLDKESRGLLLLTNNGDIANKLMHQQFEKEKEYRVEINRIPFEREIKKITSEILFNGEKTAPCKVKFIEPKTLIFILKKGRNRQIRKMCENQKLEVTDLLRIRIGNITLNNLKEGEWEKIPFSFRETD